MTIGSANAEVIALQDLLKCLGLLLGVVVLGIAGYFGNQTSDAVKAFQTAHGVDPRGYVGPGTREVLNGQY